MVVPGAGHELEPGERLHAFLAVPARRVRRGSLSARVALAETSIPEGPRRELRARRDGRRPRARRRRDPRRRPAAAPPLGRRAAPVRAARGHGAGDGAAARASRSLGRRGGARRRRRPSSTAARRPCGCSCRRSTRPTKVTLESELEGGPRRRDELELLPQRRWRVHLVHHSHLDIGYTDPQALVLRHHLAYLDSALDLRRGATTASAGRSRATCRCERWLAARPRAARDELLGHLRSGRFEVVRAAVHHARRGAVDRRARAAAPLRGTSCARRHGVEVVTAMQTDVPGAPPGLPLVLADARRALPRRRAQLGARARRRT